MKLIIVESPTKAKTLTRFLTKDYQIMASIGHIRDLPKSKLGVDIDHNFQPDYVVSKGKKKIISQLKKAASQAQEIILATDLDREGEAIAWHINHILPKKRLPASRIVFHEITRTAIKQALKHPGKIKMSLVDAQQARRVLDRLVGYKLSPLLWRKIRRGLSAGRVQSPAVRLIVEREREIKKFVPEEYWLIEVQFQSKNKDLFLAKLMKINGKKAIIKTKAQAETIKNDLKKSSYQIAAIKRKIISKSSPPPFITSTLQRSASAVFHWPARKTMREAQRLYENGLITYHRTDSVNLAQEALNQARSYIKSVYGEQYLPIQARRFKVKSKLAQEAHEAIRPTKMALEKDSSPLYRLIFNRFLACQMKEQLIEKTIVDIQGGEHFLLRANAEVEKFSGWRKVYQKPKTGLDENKAQADLSQLSKKEIVKLKKILSQQKFTQPPARYTEGALIKALEQKGIGRPSTYASIINTIQMRHYVEKEAGLFQATPIGETVVDFLIKYFTQTVDYDFTAKMEENLDAIAQGKKKWVAVIKDFYYPFAKKLEKALEKAQRQKIKVESTGKKCPKCGKGEQVIRIGRFGKFLSCSRFPDCDWKAVYIQKIKGVKCPECGGDIIIRKTRKGKRFYGCSNWPKCNWASWRRPKPDIDKSNVL